MATITAVPAAGPLTFGPLSDPVGSLEREIARRVQLEAELRDALAREERMREETAQLLRCNEVFAGILGHDLRNPLGAIVMGASYIARASESEKITRAASRILSSTERMTGMVEQLVEFSRIRADRSSPLQPIPFDVVELCARVQETLEGTGPDRAAAGRISIAADGDATGTWDHERLLRALSTVIGNAVVHGAPDRGVAVRVDGRAPGAVAISVENGGVIPPELLPVLFEPFRSSSRQNAHGIGLGLFIARHIVEAHGGAMEATSSEAQGTIVRIRLPRSAAADAP